LKLLALPGEERGREREREKGVRFGIGKNDAFGRKLLRAGRGREGGFWRRFDSRAPLHLIYSSSKSESRIRLRYGAIRYLMRGLLSNQNSSNRVLIFAGLEVPQRVKDVPSYFRSAWLAGKR